MLFTNDLDLNKNAIRNAVAHPVATDPTSPVDGQFWYRTDTDRLMVRQNGVTKTVAILDDVTVGAITGSLWDAQSVVVAISDNTPVAVTLGASTMLGRGAAGDIGALSAAQVRTLLGIEAGATADMTAAEILAALLTVDGAASGLDADLLDGQNGAYYATAASVAGLASTGYVDTAVNNLVDAAPGALNTLNELAAALGDDPNFASTITTTIAGKTGKYAVSVGDATNTSFTVTHNLGSKDVVVSVRQVADDVAVFTDWTATTSSAITVTFGTAPTTNQYRVVVVG